MSSFCFRLQLADRNLTLAKGVFFVYSSLKLFGTTRLASGFLHTKTEYPEGYSDCLVLTEKMHGLRDSLVTSVRFSFHYFHVLRLDFALFVFER